MITLSFLSDQCKEIILGSLLGDGSLKIHKPYRNARFSFRHSIHQQEYFYWKAEQLKEISANVYSWMQKADGFGGEKLRYQSRALEDLTELYRLTCKKNRLYVRRKWLNLLTPRSLMIWWLDDGSVIGNGRRGVFCTDGFPYEAQKILVQYLRKVWDIKVVIGKIIRIREDKRYEYYRLWIRSSEDLKKFLRTILPYVKVESILPKVIILYKDSQLQQRWISEVSELTGFSVDIVAKYTEMKRAKWKNFRE